MDPVAADCSRWDDAGQEDGARIPDRQSRGPFHGRGGRPLPATGDPRPPTPSGLDCPRRCRPHWSASGAVGRL